MQSLILTSQDQLHMHLAKTPTSNILRFAGNIILNFNFRNPTLDIEADGFVRFFQKVSTYKDRLYAGTVVRDVTANDATFGILACNNIKNNNTLRGRCLTAKHKVIAPQIDTEYLLSAEELRYKKVRTRLLHCSKAMPMTEDAIITAYKTLHWRNERA